MLKQVWVKFLPKICQFCLIYQWLIGEGAPRTRPFGGPNSFIFMQFAAKNLQNNSIVQKWKQWTTKNSEETFKLKTIYMFNSMLRWVLWKLSKYFEDFEPWSIAAVLLRPTNAHPDCLCRKELQTILLSHARITSSSTSQTCWQ